MTHLKQLETQGHFLIRIQLPDSISKAVVERNWNQLDQLISTETLPEGMIFKELAKYIKFSQIEFIISIRSSFEYPDEDGIWHDDGSRILAFSLSLTQNPTKIEGGILEMRKRAYEPLPSTSIPTPEFGTMIVFATGHLGFEHKINRVSQGERIIIAGWCS